MIRTSMVLSAVLLAGCASSTKHDISDDRYTFGLESVDSSQTVLSGILPSYTGSGEPVFAGGFSSFSAELDKTRGFVYLEIKPVYNHNSMNILFDFKYCQGVYSHNAETTCTNVIGSHQETLTYDYDELPKEKILDNGLKFEVGVFEM